jgi:ABC-type spermidine/putrescine transport system permease subunit II
VFYIAGSLLTIAGSAVTLRSVNLDSEEGKIAMRLWKTGVIALLVTNIGLVVAAFSGVFLKKDQPGSLLKHLLVAAPFILIRLIYAIGAAFSTSSSLQPFSPWRGSDRATWIYLCMAIIAEFIVTSLCLHASHEGGK